MKPSVVEFLIRAYEEEREFMATLSDEERSASGSLHWSAKDLIIHLAVVKERLILMLAAAVKGEEPPKYEDINRENVTTVEQYRNLSWEEVRELLERAQAELIKRTQALQEEDLVDPQRFTWQNERSAWQSGQPLWRGVIMSGFWHPILHLSEFYYMRGDAKRLDALAKRAAVRLGSLDESPAWQGRMIYDLACYYALTRQKEKAIAKLREALQVHPGLTEWSKQDTDLIAIRDDPAYEALYAR